MFGHNKKVNDKISQIDALNKIISSRKNEIKNLENIIARLRATIDEIIHQTPGIEEVDASQSYILKLREDIKALEKELEEKMLELDKKMQLTGIVDELFDIGEERKKLEEEKQILCTYTKQGYNPSKIIICAYKVPGIDDIAIDAFIYKSETSYSSKTNENRTGSLYTSLGGGRTIGFSADYKSSLFNIYKPVFNAEPIQFVTFEEACLAIGSDLYLRDKVTSLEIHSLLQQFRSGFYFYGKTNITIDEFLKMLKSGKIEYDGEKELDSLIQKGETR